jgi:hypothetical protein
MGMYGWRDVLQEPPERTPLPEMRDISEVREKGGIMRFVVVAWGLLVGVFSGGLFLGANAAVHKEPPVIVDIKPTCVQARANLHNAIGAYFTFKEKLAEASIRADYMDQPSLLRLQADLLEEEAAAVDNVEKAYEQANESCKEK